MVNLIYLRKTDVKLVFSLMPGVSNGLDADQYQQNVKPDHS